MYIAIIASYLVLSINRRHGDVRGFIAAAMQYQLMALCAICYILNGNMPIQNKGIKEYFDGHRK